LDTRGRLRAIGSTQSLTGDLVHDLQLLAAR
jgi:hypothetical protein